MKKICPRCGGSGWVVDDDQVLQKGLDALKHCPTCMQHNRGLWLLKNCGLEEAEQGLTLEDWKKINFGGRDGARQTQQRIFARKMMEQAISNESGLFTFWGTYGSGKSLSLMIIANEMRRKGIEPFYAPLVTLLNHLRTLYRVDDKARSDRFWRRMLNVHCLCLDDVTRFNATRWAASQLFELVDLRWRRRESCLTVFATNESPEQILNPTGDPETDIGYLFSRMRQGELIELQGDVRAVKGL